MVDNVPNVADVVNSWSSDIIGYKVIKTIEDFEVVEKKQRISFLGVPPQPLRSQDLALKPIGQRAWKYYTMFATYLFKVDEIIELDNIQYRITQIKNWGNAYGYYEYELMQDYKDVEQEEEEEHE